MIMIVFTDNKVDIIDLQNNKIKKVYKSRIEGTSYESEKEIHKRASDAGLAARLYSDECNDNQLVMEKLCQLSSNDYDNLEKIKSLYERLEELHDLGIYHGDIKIANIMKDDNGKIKLIDFEKAGYLNDAISKQKKLDDYFALKRDLMLHGGKKSQELLSQIDELINLKIKLLLRAEK